jgi:hypothetical protein
MDGMDDHLGVADASGQETLEGGFALTMTLDHDLDVGNTKSSQEIDGVFCPDGWEKRSGGASEAKGHDLIFISNQATGRCRADQS